jgi:hypothetical protein
MSSIIKVDTIQDQDGNNIINENANTITIGASGDTITIPAGATFDASASTTTLPDDSVTLAKMASGTDGNIISYDASGNPVAVATGTDGQVLTSTGAGSPPVFETPASATNTPAFQANLSSNQSVTNNTYTKIQCNTEIFDTNSAYDNSTNYRFTVPSEEAGRYFIYGNTGIYGNTTTDVKNAYLSIYKNGSLLHENRNDIGSTPYETQIPITIASILDLSVSDYVELYGVVNTNSGSNGLFLGDSSSNKTFFGAYKIIE